ncbi:hypothetical protein Tco_1010998 [Tanacetum coccineum]
MVTRVNGVLASGVVMIFEMDIAFYVIQGTEILSFMIRVQILLIILPIFHTHLHNPKGILVVSLAWETISKIKHAFEDKQYQPEGILELFRKLHDDVQNIHEELAEYINTPSWNRPTIYCDDDDDDDDDDEDYTIIITPYLPITDSLIMEDEHLDTIPATESDELIKSSIKNLVPIPSESEDFSDIKSECDVPDCNDSQMTNFSTFSNPLFDDSTSSDDESSHEEVIHEISFKTSLNPLFDLDEEIISSEFNRIHNEDLDSTPKMIVLIPSLIFLNHYSIVIL